MIVPGLFGYNDYHSTWFVGPEREQGGSQRQLRGSQMQLGRSKGNWRGIRGNWGASEAMGRNNGERRREGGGR